MNIKKIINHIILIFILVTSICLIKLIYIDKKIIITFENNLTNKQISNFNNRFDNPEYNLTFKNDSIVIDSPLITDALKNELLVWQGVTKVENVPNIYNKLFGNQKMKIGMDLSGGTLIYLQPNFSSLKMITGKDINTNDRIKITKTLYNKLRLFLDSKLDSNRTPRIKDQNTIEMPLPGVNTSYIYNIRFPMVTYNYLYNNKYIEIGLIVVGHKVSSPSFGENVIEETVKGIILLLFVSIIFIIIFFKKYSLMPTLLLINNFLMLILAASLMNLEINQYSLLAFIISIIITNINLFYNRPNKINSKLQNDNDKINIFRFIINKLLDINITFIFISILLLTLGFTSLYSFSIIIIINSIINVIFNTIFHKQLPTTSLSSAAL